MHRVQGTLLFTALLLLLWVPLIMFSSGNPTYQVPDIEQFSVNVSIGTAAQVQDFQAAWTFPLYMAGHRTTKALWLGNASLPASLQGPPW